MRFFLIEKHQSTVATPEELVKEACCHESGQPNEKSPRKICWDYPKYESQRQFVFNWFDDYQPTGGGFSYYITDIKVCWSAWTKVLGITRRIFFELKRELLLGRRSALHGVSAERGRHKLSGEVLCRKLRLHAKLVSLASYLFQQKSEGVSGVSRDNSIHRTDEM